MSLRLEITGAGYSLFHFIARSGEDGSSCAEALERSGQEELIQLNSKALTHLRQQDFAKGHALLLEIDSRIGSLPQIPPFLYQVLRGCWYHGAVAYYHYCVAAFDEAEAELDNAHDNLAAALADRPCLLPLVEHILDFRMQRSRIARRRGRWGEVRQHLEILRGMTESRYPVYVSAEGTPVLLSSLIPYYTSLPLEDSEKLFVERQLLDVQRRLRDLDLSAVSLCHQPGFVIPYT